MVGTVKIPSKPTVDAVVDANGFGDYDELGLACAGAGVGATILIRPGTYLESGNVAPLAGQTIIGDNGLTTDGVVVQLGNNIVDFSAIGASIDGVYFEITAAADKAFVDFDADECQLRNCTLDFTPTGAQKHRGIRFLTSDPAHCLIENLVIEGDPLSYRMISANSAVDAAEGEVLDSIFRNIVINGCQTTAVAGEEYIVSLLMPERNQFEGFRHDHSGLTMDTGGAIFYIDNTGAREGNSFSDFFLENDSGALEGTGIEYENKFWSTGDNWTRIHIRGFNDGFVASQNDDGTLTDFNFHDQTGDAVSIIGGTGWTVSGGTVEGCGGRGVIVSSSCQISNIRFYNTVGIDNISIGATGTKVTNCHGDGDFVSYSNNVIASNISFDAIKVEGDEWQLSNFKCATLDIDDFSGNILNGEVTGTCAVDAVDTKIANLQVVTLNVGAALGSDNCHFANVQVTGTATIYGGASNHDFSNCEFAVLNLAGDFTAYNKFSACYIASGTLGTVGDCDDTMFVGCRIQNYTLTEGNNVKLSGCTVDGTLTVGADAETLIIDGCRIATAVLNAPGTLISGTRITTTITVSEDEITLDGCDVTAITLANPIADFRASNCRFRGAVAIPTTAADFHFTGCRFDTAITSTTGAGDQWYSNCHCKSTVAFRGGTITLVGGQIDGAFSFDEGNLLATGVDFKSTVTAGSGATDFSLDHCRFGGAVTSSATGRVHVWSDTKGQMADYQNSTAMTIDLVNEWHAINGLSNVGADGMTFHAGGNGSITAVADGGGGTIDITSTAHGLSAGDIVCVTNTTDYDGVYVINSVTANTFNVTATWNITRTGSWGEPSTLEIQSTEYGALGDYEIMVSISSASALNNQYFEYAIFKDAAIVNHIQTQREFGTATDVGAMSLTGEEGLVAGNKICLLVRNTTSAGDLTNVNVNVFVHKS